MSLTLLGPAFVASVAYVDPGNVAANLTAGSVYGYALVWVLAGASLMAMVIQYQSAKVGLVTGQTLPQLMSARLQGRPYRVPMSITYGTQAFVIAVATDIAEVVGGALALYLLFGTPLWLGGLIVGAVSVILLSVLRTRGEQTFEVAIGGILAIIALGFLGALLWAPPDWPAAAAGLVPSIPDRDAWPLVAAMLGATVMPHAIYLHSALAIDRHRPNGTLTTPLARLLRIQKTDVGLALLLSGSVNIGMLLLAAAALTGLSGDTIEVAFHKLTTDIGAAPAVIFAIGLLASGVGSSVVGTHAGSRILKDLIGIRASPTLRRLLTIGPAVLLLTTGIPPTEVLVWSQIVLSFGVALAAGPLALFTGDRSLMGQHVDPVWLRVVNWVIVSTIVALNLVVIWWTLSSG
ncbi:MAG: Nramp family divalent metal transporter [Micropruina sp.]